MTPLPSNPTVVVLLHKDGSVAAVATNVAPDLNVVVTKDPHQYFLEAGNKPFNTVRSVPTN